MAKIQPYQHKVQYYETDKMGITHHANYIRWMEEARIDFLDQLGFPYSAMEAAGIASPVTKVSCAYKRPTTFGDTVTVRVGVEAFSGAALTICYEMRNGQGEIVCTAHSEHVFLDQAQHIVRMKWQMPEFCAALAASMEKTGTE